MANKNLERILKNINKDRHNFRERSELIHENDDKKSLSSSDFKKPIEDIDYNLSSTEVDASNTGNEGAFNDEDNKIYENVDDDVSIVPEEDVFGFDESENNGEDDLQYTKDKNIENIEDTKDIKEENIDDLDEDFNPDENLDSMLKVDAKDDNISEDAFGFDDTDLENLIENEPEDSENFIEKEESFIGSLDHGEVRDIIIDAIHEDTKITNTLNSIAEDMALKSLEKYASTINENLKKQGINLDQTEIIRGTPLEVEPKLWSKDDSSLLAKMKSVSFNPAKTSVKGIDKYLINAAKLYFGNLTTKEVINVCMYAYLKDKLDFSKCDVEDYLEEYAENAPSTITEDIMHKLVIIGNKLTEMDRRMDLIEHAVFLLLADRMGIFTLYRNDKVVDFSDSFSNLYQELITEIDEKFIKEEKRQKGREIYKSKSKQS